MIALLLTFASAADVQMTFNGRLLDANGNGANGTQTLDVFLFNSTSATVAVYEKQFSPEVQDGYFSIVLGSGTPVLTDAMLAARPVEIVVEQGGTELVRQTLLDVPYAAVAGRLAPDALSSATCAGNGTLGWDDATGTLRVCDGGAWATVWSRTGAGTPASPGWSCLQILEDGHSTGDGKYWLDPDGAGPIAAFQAFCDMSTDGGGWTLVTYAGTITTNKQTTVGSTNWFPLFDDFGTYDADARTTGTPFSHLDTFAYLMADDAELLAYRTSVPANKMIWPVADVDSWARDVLPHVPWLRLTNDNGANWYTRTNNVDVYNPGAHVYTGYDWNAATTGSGTNCDNCGNSYATGLSHRAMIYWETGDTDYAADQWFHAQPLTLTDSTGPDNTTQDVGFYLREAR